MIESIYFMQIFIFNHNSIILKKLPAVDCRTLWYSIIKQWIKILQLWNNVLMHLNICNRKSKNARYASVYKQYLNNLRSYWLPLAMTEWTSSTTTFTANIPHNVHHLFYIHLMHSANVSQLVLDDLTAFCPAMPIHFSTSWETCYFFLLLENYGSLLNQFQVRCSDDLYRVNIFQVNQLYVCVWITHVEVNW